MNDVAKSSDDQLSRHYFYLARIVLETKTPLSIQAGSSNGVFDNLLVRDANGLPAIPGSSLAGVLRHAYLESLTNHGDIEPQKSCNALFGEARDENPDTHAPSCVQVSWGCIHDSKNVPQQGLLNPAGNWRDDPVLKDAVQAVPIKRDHVRLTDKGVANVKEKGKFDRVSLTAGHRFSVELSLWSSNEKDERWDSLLNLLYQTGFRLGGKTRSGLGKIEVVDLKHIKLNLKTADDFVTFSKLKQDFSIVQDSFKDFSECDEDNYMGVAVSLTLDPSGMRVGVGTSSIEKNSPATTVSLLEKRILWDKNKASIKLGDVIIPASGIKGALRHRTEYYYRLLLPKLEGVENNPDIACETLFGYAKEGEGSEQKMDAKPGLLIIDDIYIDLEDVSSFTLAHNSIDRFTGGVREGMLYFEELLMLKKPLAFDLKIKQGDTIKSHYMDALKMAVRDLCKGRLALGAGSGRTGAGYFIGTCEWPENIGQLTNEQGEKV